MNEQQATDQVAYRCPLWRVGQANWLRALLVQGQEICSLGEQNAVETSGQDELCLIGRSEHACVLSRDDVHASQPQSIRDR